MRLQQAQRATSGMWFSLKIKQIFVFHVQFIFIRAYVDRCSPTILEDSHLCLIWIVHARSQAHVTIRAKWFLSRYNHRQLTIPAFLSSNIDGRRASCTLKMRKEDVVYVITSLITMCSYEITSLIKSVITIACSRLRDSARFKYVPTILSESLTQATWSHISMQDLPLPAN